MQFTSNHVSQYSKINKKQCTAVQNISFIGEAAMLSFSRSRVNWVDGSIEFKCDRRRSDSFPDTAKITSSTYRFQKKGLTGEVAKALLFHVFHCHW